MSKTTQRKSTTRTHRAIHAQRKAAHHRDLRQEDAAMCADTRDYTPIIDVSPHLVSFNYNPRDFDTGAVVSESCDDYLAESVNMNSTFLVASALRVVESAGDRAAARIDARWSTHS